MEGLMGGFWEGGREREESWFSAYDNLQFLWYEG